MDIWNEDKVLSLLKKLGIKRYTVDHEAKVISLYDLDDLYPIIDAAETLQFVEIENGDIKLTSIGKEFLKGDVNKRKKLFKRQLKRLKVFREALKALKKQVDEHMDREFFVELFSTHLPEENAEELVHVLIDWGRFAELIGYNADSEEVYLDEER